MKLKETCPVGQLEVCEGTTCSRGKVKSVISNGDGEVVQIELGVNGLG
jgi:hypothetical protein